MRALLSSETCSSTRQTFAGAQPSHSSLTDPRAGSLQTSTVREDVHRLACLKHLASVRPWMQNTTMHAQTWHRTLVAKNVRASAWQTICWRLHERKGAISTRQVHLRIDEVVGGPSRTVASNAGHPVHVPRRDEGAPSAAAASCRGKNSLHH